MYLWHRLYIYQMCVSPQSVLVASFIYQMCVSPQSVLVASFNILLSNRSGCFVLVFYCFRSWNVECFNGWWWWALLCIGGSSGRCSNTMYEHSSPHGRLFYMASVNKGSVSFWYRSEHLRLSMQHCAGWLMVKT